MRVVGADHLEPVDAGGVQRGEVVLGRHLVAAVVVRQVARRNGAEHLVGAADEQPARLARRVLGGVGEDEVDDAAWNGQRHGVHGDHWHRS